MAQKLKNNFEKKTDTLQITHFCLDWSLKTSFKKHSKKDKKQLNDKLASKLNLPCEKKRTSLGQTHFEQKKFVFNLNTQSKFLSHPSKYLDIFLLIK